MKKVLIIGPAWVGDMVMSQCLYRWMKSQNPQLWISVMAPSYTLPLLQAMPEVDEAIAVDFPRRKLSFFKRRALGRRFKDRQFDQAIVLPNSWKSALLPFFAKIPQRTGFVGEFRYGLLNDIRRLDPKKYPRMIDRFCALAFSNQAKNFPTEWPLPHLVLLPEACEKTLKKYEIIKDSKLLILCPGAEFGPAKQWPAEYFAEYASKKIREGWKVWILGSKKEEEISDRIINFLQEKQEEVVNFCGKTSLDEAMVLLLLADLVISNDSGLMHIASALERPLIALYGSTSPRFTPPLSSTAKVIQLNLFCQPCFKRVCPFEAEDPRHMACLRNLRPELLEQK